MPEFSYAAFVIEAIAILSIIAVSAKEAAVSLSASPERVQYKSNIGVYPHSSMTIQKINYVNDFYKTKI